MTYDVSYARLTGVNIDQIIENNFGGSSRKAWEALGVTRQTISHWRRAGIPKMRQYQLEVVLKSMKPDESRQG